jgi:hypothetical protein
MGEAGPSPALSRNCRNSGLQDTNGLIRIHQCSGIRVRARIPASADAHNDLFAERGWRMYEGCLYIVGPSPLNVRGKGFLLSRSLIGA